MINIDKFLPEYEERARASVDRALYHLMCVYKDEIQYLFENEIHYFHKAFRQSDVVAGNEGHIDMVFYSLLQETELFWKIVTEYELKDQEN